MDKEFVFDRVSPPESCPEGLPLEDCETSADLLSESRNFSAERGNLPPHWNRLVFLTRNCGNCALQCEVAVEIEKTQQTGRVKLIYRGVT